MCGIAGIYSLNQSQVSLTNLKKMTDIISHRGPDGEGHWLNTNGNIGFGHRRLSIIDLSDNGKQPMHYAERRYTITFNGEIYNYIELKNELKLKGYKFISDSDTEVLLALYDLKKENCLQDLDGMFSFAIWDEKLQTLFCARDRFGEKPFHYYLDKEQFVFASEIKQFWTCGIKKIISKEKLSRFINYSEIIDDCAPEKTFFENIYSLKAAHYLICKPDLSISIKNYWNLDSIKVNYNITFNEAIIKFTELFNRSIQYRLRSDVPLGSSLSGGLDSSSIVYSINKNYLKQDQGQSSFSARFKGYDKDEGEYIDALLNDLKNIKRFDVFLDAEEFEAEIKNIIYHQDEPFQSASIFAQYKVMQLAKKNKVTVLLDGQGADELLGGYESMYIDYLKQLFYNEPHNYTTEVNAYNAMHGFKYGYVDFFKNDTLSLKLKRKAKRLINKEQAVPQNYFFNVLKNYISGAQLQQLLRYADRNSMANSVETRLPFLNHQLVEFCFTLPDAFKLQGGWPKYILRKSFDKKLPEKITWRKNKVGFETPENNFLMSDCSQRTIKAANQYVSDHKLSNTPITNNWLLFMLGSYTN